MKRTVAVLALLLACASLSAADTILLNVGFGDFSGLGAPAQYHFFLFNKEGTSSFSTNTLGGDLGSNEGLQQCNQCDPRQFGILLFDAGIGHNGNVTYQGFIRYDAISFVSSLEHNGMLTVSYKAKAIINFTICDDPTCTGQLYAWDSNKLWVVTARFHRVGTGQYPYQFLSASFSSVPEPSTMLLFGSGIVGIAATRIRRALLRPKA